MSIVIDSPFLHSHQHFRYLEAVETSMQWIYSRAPALCLMSITQKVIIRISMNKMQHPFRNPLRMPFCFPHPFEQHLIHVSWEYKYLIECAFVVETADYAATWTVLCKVCERVSKVIVRNCSASDPVAPGLSSVCKNSPQHNTLSHTLALSPTAYLQSETLQSNWNRWGELWRDVIYPWVNFSFLSDPHAGRWTPLHFLALQLTKLQ